MAKKPSLKTTQEERFVVGSAADLAAFYGVSITTVQNWLNKGLPGKRGSRGKGSARFYLPEVTEWLKENVWCPRKAATSEDLEAEKLKIEVATKSLKLQQLAGALVDRKSEKADRMRVYNIIRNRLDAVPRELANLLPPEIQADFLIDAGNTIVLIQKELSFVDSLGPGDLGSPDSGCDGDE